MEESKSWLSNQNCSVWKEKFDNDGYLIVENILSLDETVYYQTICDELLTKGGRAISHRHDLGSHTERKFKEEENISQIMWPSLFVKNLTNGKLHQRALEIAKNVLGADMAFDFDMLIAKAPRTDTETPIHQDESYWLDMPDKRAVSVWVAMDNATVDRGCMWFVPGSHKQPLRQHKPVKEGHHVMCCDGSKGEFIAAPIGIGSCTLHHGRTVHYTQGNTTDNIRRALILNFRPAAMVEWERDHGFDHGKSKGVEDDHFGKGQII